MEARINVKMTTKLMYEFLMYHTYHTASGILSIVFAVGAFALFAFTRETADASQQMLYLVFGVIFLLYTPVSLYFRAAKQVQLNPVFKENLTYVLNDEGLTTMQGDQTAAAPWEGIFRVTETRLSILLYTTKRNACVLPKASMGGEEEKIRRLIREKLPAGKVKIK